MWPSKRRKEEVLLHPDWEKQSFKIDNDIMMIFYDLSDKMREKIVSANDTVREDIRWYINYFLQPQNKEIESVDELCSLVSSKMWDFEKLKNGDRLNVIDLMKNVLPEEVDRISRLWIIVRGLKEEEAVESSGISDEEARSSRAESPRGEILWERRRKRKFNH